MAFRQLPVGGGGGGGRYGMAITFAQGPKESSHPSLHTTTPLPPSHTHTHIKIIRPSIPDPPPQEYWVEDLCDLLLWAGRLRPELVEAR